MFNYSPSLGDNWIELLANRKWSVCAYGTVDSSMEPMVRLMADNPNGSRTFLWVSVEDLGIADVWQQVRADSAPVTLGQRLMPGCTCGAAERGDFDRCRCD